MSKVDEGWRSLCSVGLNPRFIKDALELCWGPTPPISIPLMLHKNRLPLCLDKQSHPKYRRKVGGCELLSPGPWVHLTTWFFCETVTSIY